MVIKKFNYYLKTGMTLEEIKENILKKVNGMSDSTTTGCIAHVFDTVSLKHWIISSDNIVKLYKLGENVLLFSDFKKVNDLLNTKADKSATYTKTETYSKTEVNNLVGAKENVGVAQNLINVANENITRTYATKTEVDAKVNLKANSNATVNLTGDQTIAGVKTFSAVPVSAINPTANNQVANKAYVDIVGNAKVALNKYNAEVLIPLTANQVWSVGTTQKSGATKHFNDLASAINEALKYRQTSNKFIDLYLTSHITVPSQLYYFGVDLSHLRIQGGRTTENAGFKIVASANLNSNRSDKYIFCFDRSNSPQFVGVTLKGNWEPNITPRPTGMKAGAKADNGIRVASSFLYISNCKFENFNNAVLTQYNSKTNIFNSSVFDKCNVALYTYDNSAVVCYYSTIENTNIAVKSHTLSKVYLYNGVIRKCSLGLEVILGGLINLNRPTLPTDATNKNTKDANIVYNTTTNSGIIFK